MSNTDTENSVIEDNNNLVFEKTNSIKDTLIKEDKKNILDIKNNDKKYEINGEIFNERHFKDDEKYLRFEIRDFKMEYDDPSIDLTDENEASLSTPLPLGIQKVPNGVIINSNVYLSDRNYHTIVSLDDGRGYCGVCDTDCDGESQDHINDEEHKNNLKSHVPLCKYDLCIIRKLQEKYHCGVCNQIFDIKDSNEHFASKNHEDKLLFAVNRVSDIMYDLDIRRENIDCYHFDSNAINNKDFGGFYDAYKPDDYESSIENSSDIDEIPNPFSYASMAKKPQITPKYIEVEIDGKIMHVRYDSWHMILSLKSNKYYCMVCKSDGHISLKIDHCMDKMHLSKLKKCTVVDQYIGFFIRKVDHRLYHCAHCNNLQLLMDIEDHINTRHKKRKIKNMTESPSKIDLQNTENGIEIKGKTTNTVISLENEIKELHIFCAKFTLSLLSYNMVVFPGFCCLCDKNFDEFKKHVNEVSHIEKMNRCSFLFKYDSNLIRLVKNGYHCAICNIIVQYELVDDHIIDEKHVQTLNKIITLSTNKKSIKDMENNSNTTEKNNYSEKTEINEELNGVNKIIETDKNETILIEKNKKSVDNDKKDSNLLEKSKKSIEKDADVDSDDDLEDTFFNTEELVFLKRKNVFAKVALISYNTLVSTGDGTKYCVLCSVNIDFDRLKKHTESRQHIDNMRKYKYLDKYEKHLLRQILHTYHCSVCNVMFSYRELNIHLTWPIHKQELDKCHKIVKNNRKIDIKNGTKQITIDLQKEILYTTYVEPKIKIGIYYEFSKNNHQEISKKSKIVINNGIVFKINWDSWNGFSKTKTGFKCLLCQRDIKTYEQTNHSKNSSHIQKVEENFLKEFNPALIRKINDTTLNCVTCNVEIPNKSHIVDHIKGKKHEKTHELLIKDSSECNNYTDCTDDIFTLQ